MSVFFNEISHLLIDTLNHSYQVGQLSTSQRQALITSVEKKEKDKKYIKNWRLNKRRCQIGI